MFNDEMNNIAKYNGEMAKSMIDKIFFADKIEAEIIVDYGCADGATLQFLHHIFPNWTFIGFDISQKMVDLATKNCPFARIFIDWDELVEYLETLEGDKAVVCNSLIHEVYHYGSPEDVEVFWKRIFGQFKFICIRDMMVSETSVRQSDEISVLKIRKKHDPKMIREFEHNHGMINQNWSFIHFLLKYRYVDNWEREVAENYLPINLETFLQMIPDNYDPILFHHYSLPFVRRQIKKDFGIDMNDKTHIQLILERR